VPVNFHNFWHKYTVGNLQLEDYSYPTLLTCLPGAAAPDLESNPMRPSGLVDQLIREKAHPRVTNPLQVVLKAVDSTGVDTVLIQLIPSIDHSVGKEKSTNV